MLRCQTVKKRTVWRSPYGAQKYILLLIIVVADFHTSDFSADGLGQVVHKLNHSGVFVRCGVSFNVVLDFLFKFVALFLALYEDNRCLYNLTSYRVGNGGDCTFKNVGQFHNYVFYLKWSYAVAGRLDDIVNSADVPEVAVHARSPVWYIPSCHDFLVFSSSP